LCTYRNEIDTQLLLFHDTDKDILDLEKEVVEQKAKNEQEENNRKEQLENARKEEEESARQWVKEEQDLSRVKLRITEYDSLNEIMAEFYGSTELRNASWNGWVEIGTDKCVLNVLTKGYLILAKDKKDIWSASFRYDNQKYQGKPFAIPLEADNLTSAVRAADTWISNKFGGAFGGGLVMSRYAKFRKHPMTEAQRQTLKRYKIDIGENDMTKGQAMDLLTKLRFGQMKIWKMQIKEALQEKKQNEKKNSAAILARSKDNSISSAV
jgi:ATP-dependent helicase IRC3